LFASRIISFTPGFSPVLERDTTAENRFNGFRSAARETVETVSQQSEVSFHRAEARCE
jgi:hypothetical protein